MIMNSTKPFVKVVLLLFITILMGSCKKSEEPQPTSINLNYLHGGLTKSWRMAEYYVNGVNFAIPTWAADNLLVFNKDNTGMWIFGVVDKEPTDTIKCDFFDWSFSLDSLTIIGHNSSPDNRIRKAVVILNEHIWVEEFKAVSGDVYRYVYVDVVLQNPGAGTNNKRLTNGLTKIWKIHELLYNGQPQHLPEWRKEDYLLFNTDGTGWFTFGEDAEFPNDTTNNDHFFWWFSANETRLELEEFSQNSFEIADCNIITLSDTLMIVEEQVMINGAMTLVRVTRVPAVK